MSAVGRRHGSGMLGETAGVRGREALDPSGPVVNSESGQSDFHNRFIRTVRNGRRPKKKKKIRRRRENVVEWRVSFEDEGYPVLRLCSRVSDVRWVPGRDAFREYTGKNDSAQQGG